MRGGGIGGSASGASSATATNAKAKVGQSSSGGKRSAGGSGGVALAQKSRKTGGVISTVQEDGRFKRLKEGIDQDVVVASKGMSELCDLGDLIDLEKSLGGGTTFVSELKARMRELCKVISSCKTLSGRISRSANKEQLEEQLSKATKLCEQGVACKDILACLLSSSASHASVLEAFQNAEEREVKLSKTMAIMKWSHEALQKMMVGQREEAVAMMKSSSPQVVFTTSLGAAPSELEHIATCLLEDVLMRMLQKLRAVDFQGQSPSAALRDLMDFLAIALESANDEAWLARPLRKDISLLSNLVSCKDTDPVMVQSALESFDEKDVSSDLESASPISCFIVEHMCGKMLYQYAKDRCKSAEADIRIGNMVEETQASQNKVLSLLASPSPVRLAAFARRGVPLPEAARTHDAGEGVQEERGAVEVRLPHGDRWRGPVTLPRAHRRAQDSLRQLGVGR